MQKMLAGVFALMLAIGSAAGLAAAEGSVPGAAAPAPAGLQAATATRVIDGDTVVLESGERVRLLGIDAPERGEAGAAAATAQLWAFLQEAERHARGRFPDPAQGHPGEAVGDGAPPAEGLRAPLWLRFEGRRRDRYRRLLAYLIRADGACLNAALVRRGVVRVLRRYPFQGMEEFLRLEAEAQAERVGLWRDAEPSPQPRRSAAGSRLLARGQPSRRSVPAALK
ncbi:MAG: thermonuclease family protein [Candidatus Tectomicrobia bacterium]|nr:thermonuclease family protein [Candidatus Tectomicrobia bacterium]